MPEQIGRVALQTVELDVTQDLGSGLETVTYRFSSEGQWVPRSMGHHLPMIMSITTTPTSLDIGRSLGTRETVKIEFQDAINDGDVQGGEPPAETTFWALLRARSPYLNGRAVRIKDWSADADAFELQETRTYVVKNIQGPDHKGRIVLNVMDATGTFSRGRQTVPVLGTAALLGDMSDSATTATLTPSEFADDYETPGLLRIDDELVEYTRSGVDLTFTQRGALGTTAAAHDADTLLQPSVNYSDTTVAAVVGDILTRSGLGSFVDQAAWDAIDAQWLGFTLNATLVEPERVEDLLSDLMQIFPFTVHYVPAGPRFDFQATEAAAFQTDPTVITSASVNDDALMIVEDDDRAFTRLKFYFGAINVIEDLDQPSNYSNVISYVDSEVEDPSQRGEKILKELFCRWMDADEVQDSLRLTDRLIGIAKNDQRKIHFTINGRSDLRVGDFFQIESAQILDSATETVQPVNVQMVRSQPDQSREVLRCVAQDLFLPARVRLWAEDDLPDYDLQTTEDQNTYLSWGDDSDPSEIVPGVTAHNWL